ncbi:MAG: GNAT family N-acetyltransferase, partial [Candidatus Eisenbacteria bacterium]|nr:GNAT family N-acetyltransferase [Candidatus Eisenbacteria bacterium]
MSHPFLIGRRVQLRAIEEEDAPAYVEWLSSPDMREFLLIRFPQTTQGEREWIASMRGKEKPPANLVFSIERKSDGRHIGCCALHQIDWVHRRAMTGSFLGPPALRGKGLGLSLIHIS